MSRNKDWEGTPFCDTMYKIVRKKYFSVTEEEGVKSAWRHQIMGYYVGRSFDARLHAVPFGDVRLIGVCTTLAWRHSIDSEPFDRIQMVQYSDSRLIYFVLFQCSFPFWRNTETSQGRPGLNMFWPNVDWSTDVVLIMVIWYPIYSNRYLN